MVFGSLKEQNRDTHGLKKVSGMKKISDYVFFIWVIFLQKRAPHCTWETEETSGLKGRFVLNPCVMTRFLASKKEHKEVRQFVLFFNVLITNCILKSRRTAREIRLMLVFEHVDYDLEAFMNQRVNNERVPVSVENCRNISRQLLSGLDFLHSHQGS